VVDSANVAEVPRTGWDWLLEHPEALDEYAGKHVAIWEDGVVVHGTDVYALRDELQKSPYWDKPLLIFRVPTREERDSLLIL
jgi:hypothetical protein